MQLSPVWSRAPGRAWRRGGLGPLLALALLAATTSAASAPMFVQLSGDDALATVRAAVPPLARAADSDGIRVVSGAAAAGDRGSAIDALRHVPGLTEPALVAFSVTPEARWTEFARPAVRHGDALVRARLAAVDDPAGSLVAAAVDGATGSGVWLPEPVADQLGVVPGDDVAFLVQTSDAQHAPRPGAGPDVSTDVRVDGVYRVADDGRRPADPPDSTRWARRAGAIPADPGQITLASYLVVADPRTAERLAAATGDTLMWTAEAGLRPALPLEEATATAAAVAELRELQRTPSDEPPSPLRAGVVSGVETVVASAVALRAATADRVGLLAAAGAGAGLLAALVVCLLAASDRRDELRHGAAVGIGPLPAAGAWLLEAAVPALIAVAGGVVLARTALSPLGPAVPPDAAATAQAIRAAAVVGAAGLALVGAVAAGSVLRLDRPLAGRRAYPWVWIAVAVAATAMTAAATARAGSPGPVAVVAPALAALAVGAVAAAAAARLGRLRRAGPPASSRRAGRWLGRRRAASEGGELVLPVAALALGLALVMVTATAVAATRTAIADRTAVRAGASAAAQIGGVWQLQDDPEVAPTVGELLAGVPVPVPRPVAPPPGASVVWRSLASFAGDDGFHDVLAVDPEHLAAVAAWGEGRHLQEVRGLLDVLSAELASPTPGAPAGTVPMIVVNDPSVSVGDLLVLYAQGWQSPARVVATTDAFPGLGSRPLIVAPASVLLDHLGRDDPRLAPPADVVTSPRLDVETWLWSAGSVDDLVASLDGRGATVLATTSREQLGLDPAIHAAERSLGYLVALAAFVAITSLVVLAEQARRSARRSRAADALLARAGLGSAGIAAARSWQLAWAVMVALVAAVITTLLVTPVGARLFDLDQGAHPSFEFRLAWPAAGVTLGVALLGFVVARWAAQRGSSGRRAEEQVLREG